jgi:hypothetical protein
MARARKLLPPRVLNYHLVRIGAQIQYILECNEEFMNSSSFREQCARACILLRDDQQNPVPFSIIGKLLSVERGTVEDHYRKFLAKANETGMEGRPPLLSDDQVQDLVAAILDGYRNRQPMRVDNIKEYIDSHFHRQISSDSIRHILMRHGAVRSIKGVPMETNRLEVTADEINEYFALLFRTVHGAPAAFVFNMDEMGHHDWADAKKVVCYAPSDSTEDVIYYPVPRAGKRITLIACIAADGSALKPSLVIVRKTFDAELALQGYSNDKLDVYSQSKSFIDIAIFEDWFETNFIPELQRRRDLHHYGGDAFIILDNCTAHAGPTFQHLCQRHKVTPIFLPPHSSNQLQPLDVSVFGICKNDINRANKLSKKNVQTDHIVRILKGFHEATSGHNIVSTFRNAGISLVLDCDENRNSQDPPKCVCKVTPHTARCLLEPVIATFTIPQEYLDEEISDEDLILDDPEVQNFVTDLCWEL